MAGYVFLHILSAEGRHSPANSHITGEEYEASRLRTLEMLVAQKSPIPADQTEREQMLGSVLTTRQKMRRIVLGDNR